MTLPAHADRRSISVGYALREALRGQTRSLTMLVGFFSDGNAEGGGDESPLGLIRSEAAEELTQPWRDEASPDGSSFRLLFGALAGDASGTRLALTTFWWLCRWRAVDPDAADAWRTAVEGAWAERPETDRRAPGAAFETLACRVFRSPAGAPEVLPLLHRLEPDDESGRLGGLEPDERAGLDAWRESWGTVPEVTARTAAVLSLFFVTRSAHVRLQAGPPAPSGPAGGIFHGKLYVVERPGSGARDAPDTVVLMGSPNWSTGALFGSGSHANTEVASISRVPGWPWDDSTSGESAPLGARLTWTARALFEHPSETRLIARWGASLDELPDHDELVALLEEAAARGQRFLDPELAEPERSTVTREVDASMQPLAFALLQLIEQALGVAGVSNGPRRRVEEHLQRTGQMFAGRRIQSAQGDGAVRLLELLSPRRDELGTGFDGRGAFLADEAGLGKSVVAQLVAFGIVLDKALDPRRHAGSWPRVTILAPRQLVVAERGSGPDSGQWQRHRLELIEELAVALRALGDTAGSDEQKQRIAEASQWIERERAMPDGGARSIRVFSHSAFQRQLKFGGGKRAQQVLADHAHIAASEVVLLDESHNLRNGSSSRTRLARFLLSLPVPGESWPVYVGEHSERHLVSGSTATPADGDGLARKVLCLTATPFNNAFDDLVTQIGHFARAQLWSFGDDAPEQLSIDGTEHPVVLALRAWSESNAGSRLGADHHKAFKTLLERVARAPLGRGHPHLSSGRRLDPDPRASEFEERVGVTRDGGPTYVWPDARYRELRSTIPVVSSVLERMKEADGTGVGSPTPREVEDATQRLDAVLGHLVVQRSRVRITRLMPADIAATQFRSPNLPRRPLPLNEDDSDLVGRADAAILERLFQQLGVEGTDGLSLFAYRLGTLRGGVGAMGSGEQKTSNLLGFQRMQLIKRLQSSRYAFLQTLLRGPLRRSLVEMVLLGWVAATVDEAWKAPAGLPDDWRKIILQRCSRTAERLADATRSDVAHRSVLSLAVGGFVISDTLPATLSGWVVADETGDLDQALRLTLGEETFTGATAALAWEPDDPRRRWLDIGLLDLVGDDSELVTDVDTCLRWAFSDRQLALAKVVPVLSAETMAALHEDVLRAGGSRGLLSSLRRHLATAPLGDDRKDLEEWLTEQLQEPRMRGLVGWVLAQAAARAKDSPAPAGDRSLVFSEYADTVDHLSVVIQCLALVSAEELESDGLRRGRSRFADDLLQLTQETVELLGEEAEQVKRDAPDYEAPLPPMAQLFAMPDPGERRRRVLRLAAGLGEVSGIRTGQGASRLRGGEPVRAGGLDPDEVAEEPEAVESADADAAGDSDSDSDPGSDAADDPEVEALVDAFAPWYRINPVILTRRSDAPADEASALLRRLDAAAREPLHLLITTEVLAEGVNLQECGVVVHFDLPWNPTRLIQRNGRVDRRIEQAYEDREGRHEVWERLIALSDLQAHALRAPDFRAPKQVFHLTAVPPEPAMDDPDLRRRVEAVRGTLLRKLQSIQLLFGLSSWPIVLRAAEARAVLDGELEVETPGFRRREELFARRSDLLDRLADTSRPAACEGTITLRLPAARFRPSIVQRLAGAAAGPVWGELTEAGVQSWSSLDEVRAHPVRSGLEWREGVRALSGWAVGQSKRGAPWLVRWALDMRAENRTKSRSAVQRIATTPARVSAEWVGEDVGWLPFAPRRASLLDLEVDSEAFVDLRKHPTSPTDAAEELLDLVATWLLLEGALSEEMVELGSDEGVPGFEAPGGEPLAQAASSRLERQWQELGTRVTTERYDVERIHAAAPHRSVAGAINLRLVVDDALTETPA